MSPCLPEAAFQRTENRLLCVPHCSLFLGEKKTPLEMLSGMWLQRREGVLQGEPGQTLPVIDPSQPAASVLDLRKLPVCLPEGPGQEAECQARRWWLCESGRQLIR